MIIMKIQRAFSTTTLCLIFSMKMVAQPSNISSTDSADYHRLRAGDRLRGYETTYIPDMEAGEGTLWDMRDVPTDGSRHRLSYTSVHGDSSIIAGIENNTRHYYHYSGDTLLLSGWENNLTKVFYDRPEAHLLLPLSYGRQYEGLFHGGMVYCERLYSRVFGSCQVSVDGTGSMLLPSGDTLRYVHRVHVRKTTAEHHFPAMKTEAELREYIDSVAPYTTDSIITRMLTDSNLIEIDTYRWYAAGYRYPILETVSKSARGQEPYSTIAYYYPPEEQERLDDEINEQIRQHLSADRQQGGERNGNSGNGNGNDSNDNSGNSSNPFKDVRVYFNGTTVTVNYDITEDVTVTGMVCDISGMVYRQSTQQAEAGNQNQMTIDCAGLRHGEYILYLSAGGAVQSQNISIK